MNRKQGLFLILLWLLLPAARADTLVPVNVGLFPLLSINGAESATKTNYFSLSILYGSAKNVKGYSNSMVANVVYGQALGMHGAAFFSYNRKITGLQFGLVNKADTVIGAQLGLVNLSKSVKGAPLGLFNIVKDGRIRTEYWFTLNSHNIGWQFASKYAYSMLFLGFGFPSLVNPGCGYGVKIPIRDKFFIQSDIQISAFQEGETATEMFDTGEIVDGISGALIAFRFGAGYQFFKYLGLKAGFSHIRYSQSRPFQSERLPADYSTDYTGFTWFVSLQI